MAEIILNTTLFGTLEFDSEDGLSEYPSMQLEDCEEEMDVRLDIEGGLVNFENQKLVLSVLEKIPAMCRKAKEEAIARYPQDETVRIFVDYQLEEIEEDLLLEHFQVDSVDEITPQEFIEKLCFYGITVEPDYRGNVTCFIDLCFGRDCTDELLVVHFNQDMEITRIAHES